ncbi:hypothetical protein GWI33_013674 [Rhynchophorus ferrugineus]|uniref:Uncharacterized protein n=1 Tax=Rhynchophorus ferrugineus TaxID=354439 RepID=A0A834M9R3_RHYFE|nr:hypothetical protein GWI33_013674 [Rhynchophorus ferrugineus]
MVLLLSEAGPTRRRACSPLPQCCRRYVHSIGCRGVAAKRNSYTFPQQENSPKNKYLFEENPSAANVQRLIEQNHEFENDDVYNRNILDGAEYFIN